MTEISRAILAKELGEYILTYLEQNPYHEENVVERECALILRQIIETLDHDDLDDFECLDRIVDILHAADLSTTRHDF